MKSITLLALMLLASIATAAEIPSSATSDYAGDGYNCRFLAFAVPPEQHRRIVLNCMTPTPGEVTLGSFTAFGCPDTRTPIPLTPIFTGPFGQHLAITSITATAISGRIGQLADVWGCSDPLGGHGQCSGAAVTLVKVQLLASPLPYPGCGAAAAYNKPRDR